VDNAGFVFPIFFVAVFACIWVVAIATVGVGVAALISLARQPATAFGPWWDNTKSSWLIGVAVSFVVPFGSLITGISWFRSGKAPLNKGSGMAGRPFWIGPPKPVPYAFAPPPYPLQYPPQYPPPGPPPA
jgi:hypothetical protein